MKQLASLLFLSLVALCMVVSLGYTGDEHTADQANEPHLANIRQLTFHGENAEAYFSFREDRLIFQSNHDTLPCDQIFVMDLNNPESATMVSTGFGKTTCSYFLPGDSIFLYSSTHRADTACPAKPDYSRGYVWPVYAGYDIFAGTANNPQVKQLTKTPGYDAEATVSPTGDRIIFTSLRNGDLDLYSMKLDGSDIRQLTSEVGYDGGAFYSFDGKQIVYRAHHPQDSASLRSYQELLNDGLIRPSVMEIWIMNADGSEKRQLTNYNAASFAPFFHPDGKRIIFSSNRNDPKGRNFDLFMINIDGTGLEQITSDETFDGFPMFSRDGRRLVFASNRNAAKRGDTNIFIADWLP